MTSNRLTDTETSSESSAKRATLLNDEVESLRAQIRTLTTEMEEQERSLKSQVRYHSITLSLFQACNLKGCIGSMSMLHCSSVAVGLVGCNIEWI